MPQDKDIKRKIRDGDKTEVIRFVRIWLTCFLACPPLILAWGFGKISLLTLVLALVFVPFSMAVMVMVITKKIGTMAGSLYGGPKAHWTVKEELAGDLEKIRYSKRQGRFNEALALVNDILKRLPHDPDALFLKAQILHDGFGHDQSAKKCLDIIMKEIPASEILHRWASSLFEDISREQKKGNAPSLSGEE